MAIYSRNKSENKLILPVMPTKQDDIINRAELLQQAIATLQLQIQQIKAIGEVAPPNCCVLRAPCTQFKWNLLVLQVTCTRTHLSH